MKLLEEYRELEKQILEYFNYGSPFAYNQLDDQTDMYWNYNGSRVIFADDPITPEIIDSGIYYANELVGTGYWRGSEYTMIYTDNNCGDKLLQIFDNSKEQTELPEEALDEIW
jgi:hypothetical protein